MRMIMRELELKQELCLLLPAHWLKLEGGNQGQPLPSRQQPRANPKYRTLNCSYVLALGVSRRESYLLCPTT